MDDCLQRIQLPLPGETLQKKEKLFKKYSSSNTLMADHLKRAAILIMYVGHNLWGAAINKENVLQKVVFQEYKRDYQWGILLATTDSDG